MCVFACVLSIVAYLFICLNRTVIRDESDVSLRFFYLSRNVFIVKLWALSNKTIITSKHELASGRNHFQHD